MVRDIDYVVHECINTDLSQGYVRDCFDSSQLSPDYNIFKRQQLPFSTKTNSPCPFAPKMCLNSNPSDRVQYRKIMRCSPVTTDRYVVNGTSCLRGRGYNYTAAYYGINNLMNSSLHDFGNLLNATYVHSDYKELELGYDSNFSHKEYNIM